MEAMESDQGLITHSFTTRFIMAIVFADWFVTICQLSQSQFERLTAERLDAESKRLRDDVGTRVTSSRREVCINQIMVI